MSKFKVGDTAYIVSYIGRNFNIFKRKINNPATAGLFNSLSQKHNEQYLNEKEAKAIFNEFLQEKK